MINNIKAYFKKLKASYNKNPQEAITNGLKIALTVVLTAGFYPIVRFGAAAVVNTLSKLLIPILSLGTAASLGYIITDLAGPKISGLVENMHSKFSTASKNMPTTNEVKEALYDAYDSIPTFTAVKAMLFSTIKPAANASNEESVRNVTGLKSKPN